MFLKDLDKYYNSDVDMYELFIGENSRGEDIVFYVMQAGNDNHERTERKYARQREASRRNPKKERALSIRIVAESILANWIGLVDDNGIDVPCTLENKITVLTKYKHLFVDVLSASTEINNFMSYDDESDNEFTPEEESEKN